MVISSSDLQYNKSDKKYEDGYRIVYFNKDDYSIGEYCKTIEGFMMNFVECAPIMDHNDIPLFISIDDLMNRYLTSFKDITSAALYKTDGTCIIKKDRNELKI